MAGLRRRAACACSINVITNGLLLTPEVVDRLTPFGLNGVKITLDGDRDTHNRMRPLRGGQGTFDKIIENIRQVAGKCRIAIGGNFDESSVDSYPALLDFLREQEFADKLVEGQLQADHQRARPARRRSRRAVHPADRRRRRRQAARRHLHDRRPAPAAARASATRATSLDEKMSFLREETKKRGFPTVDGVHMGPCEIHRQHAHTIGPDGSLYACPGFTGDATQSTGHIDGRQRTVARRRAAQASSAGGVEGVRRLRVHPGLRRRLLGRRAHRARRHEQAELPQDRFQAGVVSLAHQARGAMRPSDQLITRTLTTSKEKPMKNDKKPDKKTHAPPLARRRRRRPSALSHPQTTINIIHQ